MSKPTVMIADDHALVAEGLKALLADHVELLGSVEDGRALLEAALRLKPQIILLDISMPGLNGIEAARQLRKTLPGAKLIFVTQHLDALYVREALRMGVSGYVSKLSAACELLAAVEAVEKGGTYITPLLNRISPNTKPLRGEPQIGGNLTSREREVLQLVAEGNSLKDMAATLGVSLKTVQFHKANLTRKLALHSTAELVKYALRSKITPA